MRRRALWLVAGGCSAALLAPALAAHPAPGGGIGDDTGAGLLERAADAAERLDYQGTQFVAFWSESGSTSAIVEVSHVVGEGSVMRMEPTPQNPAGAVFRSGVAGAPDTGFDPATLGLLTRNFETAVTGSDSVAGRAADVVAVRRPGDSPVARFWLDRETGLVLRREVLDGDGRTLRASAFIRVTFGLPTRPDMDRSAAADTPKASGDPLDQSAVAELRDDGWRLPATLPAGLELFDARLTGADDEALLHLTYSDGVSTLSLFQQRGRLDTGSLDGFRRIRVADTRVYASTTFPRRVVWSGGGKVFTLVAECQQDTLESVVGALPHGEPSRGLRARLRDGFGRVGSWLNPF